MAQARDTGEGAARARMPSRGVAAWGCEGLKQPGARQSLATAASGQPFRSARARGRSARGLPKNQAAAFRYVLMRIAGLERAATMFGEKIYEGRDGVVHLHFYSFLLKIATLLRTARPMAVPAPRDADGSRLSAGWFSERGFLRPNAFEGGGCGARWLYRLHHRCRVVRRNPGFLGLSGLAGPMSRLGESSFWHPEAVPMSWTNSRSTPACMVALSDACDATPPTTWGSGYRLRLCLGRCRAPAVVQALMNRPQLARA